MPDQVGAARSAPLTPSEQPLSNTPYSILVIGAGFGGIASALRMRARGYDVTLIDRLDAIGGRAQVFERGGFYHDAGPTVPRHFYLMSYLPYSVNAARIMSNFARLTPGIDFIFTPASNLTTGHLLRIQTKKFIAFHRRMLRDMPSC